MCSTSLLLLQKFQCNYYLMLPEPAALQRVLLSSSDISEPSPCSRLPGRPAVPSAPPAAAWLHLAAPFVLDPRPPPPPRGTPPTPPGCHTPAPRGLPCARALHSSQEPGCLVVLKPLCTFRAHKGLVKSAGGLSLTWRLGFRDPGNKSSRWLGHEPKLGKSGVGVLKSL